jgi:hypothetical protein
MKTEKEIDKVSLEYEHRIKQLTKQVEDEIDRANYWGIRNAKLQVKIMKLEDKLENKKEKK